MQETYWWPEMEVGSTRLPEIVLGGWTAYNQEHFNAELGEYRLFLSNLLILDSYPCLWVHFTIGSLRPRRN